MRKVGGEPLLPPESFFVQERRGPLFAGEIARAEAWITAALPAGTGAIASDLRR